MLPAPLNALLAHPHKPAVNPLPDQPAGQEGILPLWQVEKAAIEKAIAYCHDNIPNAVALLGVSPSTIYRKIQGWQKS
ncbi:MAG: helix-turn-helix domain-containing protein [Methylovulum sp.]|nr:helix-turn-helix domain-containing protein [Methylovulum sp.]